MKTIWLLATIFFSLVSGVFVGCGLYNDGLVSVAFGGAAVISVNVAIACQILWNRYRS
jgi:hypothetical protein